MEIYNETNYSTRYLRKLFIACEKYEGSDHKTRIVQIKRAKCRVSGYAWYNSNELVLRLPKRDSRDDGGEVMAHKVAQIYIHELGHNHNLRHKEMSKWWEWPISFWPQEPLPFKQMKEEKPKKSVTEIREAKAIKKLEEWEKKMKKAKTFVQKYKKKVKYYENRKKKAANNERAQR